MSTVSQQLRLLRGEDIVSRRRAGKHVFYSLADGLVTEWLRRVLSEAEAAGAASSGATRPADRGGRSRGR
jgi:DNA-binding transcriptional ArsR family regulator